MQKSVNTDCIYRENRLIVLATEQLQKNNQLRDKMLLLHNMEMELYEVLLS